MQAYRDLQKEILVSKNELTRRRAPPPLGAIEPATMEELSRDIDIYTVSGHYLFVLGVETLQGESNRNVLCSL